MSRELTNDTDFPAVTSLTGAERIPLSQGGLPKHATPLQISRLKLTANTNFYVDIAGGSDDTGDGSEGAPWQTLQFAHDEIVSRYDFGGYKVTLNMAAGTYDYLYNTLNYYPMNSNGVLKFKGVDGDPDQVIVSAIGGGGGAFNLYGLGGNVYWEIEDVTLLGNNTILYGVYAIYAGASIVLTNVNLSGQFSAAIFSSYGSSIEWYGNMEVTTTAAWTRFIRCIERAMVYFDVTTFNRVSGTHSFGTYAVSDRMSYIFWRVGTYTGTASGVAYSVTLNSILVQNSTVPGSAGSTATGGQVG